MKRRSRINLEALKMAASEKVVVPLGVLRKLTKTNFQFMVQLESSTETIKKNKIFWSYYYTFVNTRLPLKSLYSRLSLFVLNL